MAKTTETKKTPAKTKSTAKKSTPKKQQAKKPAAKKPPVQQENQPLFRKKTIAERKVAFKTRNWGATICWALIPVFLALAAFFKFCMLGYSFTVLVCLVMVGILLFYALIPMFAKTYPYTARRLKRVFTTLLCIGLIVVSITECIFRVINWCNPKKAQ